MKKSTHHHLIIVGMVLIGLMFNASAWANSMQMDALQSEWPRTDFSRATIDLSEIISGGPPKDGILAIDSPLFGSVADNAHLGDKEPVITLRIAQDARAYPLRILIYHEIVNDVVAGTPVSITYCPLCNAALVFERSANGRTLDFGTTGKLRHSDMIMYDRQTESWWQQFTGEAIVGAMTGQKLTILPSRIESFEQFKKKYAQGKVLIPKDPSARPYGRNPYANYDTSKYPFLLVQPYEGEVSALERVVAIGTEAWPLSLLREKREIRSGSYILRWTEGQNSALDTSNISEGRDIGNVSVFQENHEKKLQDVVYHIPFAFAFKAFHSNGTIHTK